MTDSDASAFDNVAATYDAAFSNTLIGAQQRKLVREHLQKWVSGKPKLNILEINCGTGEDALWLASLGHNVTATDASAHMIAAAEQKLNSTLVANKPQFIPCTFEKLYGKFKHQKFDFIFSNFSGLNCLAPGQLQILSSDLNALLNRNGYMAVVIFGKHTAWEIGYFLSRLNLTRAFSRWHNKPVRVRLEEGVGQSVYYYTVRHFCRLMREFQLVEKRPVGLFVPPSYMESLVQKRESLFRKLIHLEQRFSHLSILSSWADHTYLLFKKKAI